jgi:hypothetical protein
VGIALDSMRARASFQRNPDHREIDSALPDPYYQCPVAAHR